MSNEITSIVVAVVVDDGVIDPHTRRKVWQRSLVYIVEQRDCYFRFFISSLLVTASSQRVRVSPPAHQYPADADAVAHAADVVSHDIFFREDRRWSSLVLWR
jgi:hypothetical protein